LEIDINDIDQQRSEYQRLRAEAHTKPAAKKVNSNDDEDKKMPAKEARSNTKKPAAKKETEIHEDKKMPASNQLLSTATPTATGTTATSATPTSTSVAASATPTQEATGDGIADKILPNLDDLFLPEEEKELICDRIIPWLDNNDFTLSDDGTFYSDSIIPPVVQQWLIRRGA